MHMHMFDVKNIIIKHLITTDDQTRATFGVF